MEATGMQQGQKSRIVSAVADFMSVKRRGRSRRLTPIQRQMRAYRLLGSLERWREIPEFAPTEDGRKIT